MDIKEHHYLLLQSIISGRKGYATNNGDRSKPKFREIEVGKSTERQGYANIQEGREQA